MSNQETQLRIVKMSEVELQEVNWLWYPYIPFGKITIIQGDPGEGKTTLALRLAAACSTGQAFPGMETTEPFNVIYQTAEDGLGDTVKPRLMEAGADQDRVLNIAEDSCSLSYLRSGVVLCVLTGCCCDRDAHTDPRKELHEHNSRRRPLHKTISRGRNQ